jgi:hypothetical protein
MTVSHAGTMPLGISSLNVNCSFNGALVCLTMNGQIIGTGLAAGGSALINFPTLTVPDTVFVTITGFNQLPYQGQVLVIPAAGPYVIYQNNTIHDNTEITTVKLILMKPSM